MIEIIVAIITALGVIGAAWITIRRRGRNNENGEHAQGDVVAGDKVGGDVVGRDKIESHDHVHLEGTQRERKNTAVYFLEKAFTFIVTSLLAGGIFGVVGYIIGSQVGGEDAAGVGGVIGCLVGIVAGFVNAGNIKRTKGII